MNILLTISYDGTRYAGWQRQLNGITVQEKIENALGEVFLRRVAVTAASRTDAGVHALGQRASFFIDECLIPSEKLPYVINRYLPSDISVTMAQPVEDNFNPRFAAKRKLYEYAIYNSKYQNPKLRNYTWHVPYPLDIDAMRSAAVFFVGEHDFSAFRASGGSAKTSRREIYRMSIEKNGGLIKLEVDGNGFLYNMVRIIAGTLVYVGCNKIKPSEMEGILLAKDRTLAGKTAPPQGLTLMEVGF